MASRCRSSSTPTPRRRSRGSACRTASTIELQGLFARSRASSTRSPSIGMFEHVGIANHPAYFKTMHRLLKPARALPASRHHPPRQTRPSARSARKRPEFAALDALHLSRRRARSSSAMSVANLERHGFEVHDVEGWREHYRRTCRLWHDRLLANCDAAEREVGVGEDADVARLSRRLARSPSSAPRSAFSRRWRRSASAAPPACRRRGRICIAEALSRDLPPSAAHHIDEAREARGDEGGVVDRDRPVARQAHDQRRHRDAMIHVRRDHAAAGRAALAVHDQVVALDLDRDAVRRAALRRSPRAGPIP